MDPKPIFVVSDSTGETAERVVRAALLQYPDARVPVRLFTRVRDRDSVSDVIKKAREHGSMIVFTIVRPELQAAAKHIPVLWSANFSLGVALLRKMTAMAAAQLGPEFEAEILEVHHRAKRDAPSGTALALGMAIADARQHSFADVARFARQGQGGGREAQEIGFAVMRAADVIGEHTVMFASEGERLELTHRASSRSIFAIGAVRSAIWLARQGAGWYDITDVLG